MTITGCRPPLGRRMTGGRDLLRRSRGGTADTARLRRAAVRRKGSSPFDSTLIQSARIIFSIFDALAERLLQRIATPCPSGSSPERISNYSSYAGFISSRMLWVLARTSQGSPLARPLYSPDQRARRRVPASGSPGSATRHHRICFSAVRRRAADPGLT